MNSIFKYELQNLLWMISNFGGSISSDGSTWRIRIDGASFTTTGKELTERHIRTALDYYIQTRRPGDPIDVLLKEEEKEKDKDVKQ